MRLLSLFKALTKNWFRSKSGIFFSLLFPITLLIIFTAVFGSQDNVEYSLYVQNQDVINGEATELSQEFITGLENTDTFDLIDVDREMDLEEGLEGDSSFDADASRRGLIIPEGFHEQSMNKIVELRMDVIQDTMNQITETSGDNGEQLSEDEREEFASGMERMQEWESEIGDQDSAEIILLTNQEDQASQVVHGTVRGVMDTFNREAMGVEESAVTINSQSLVSENLQAVDYYLPGFIAAFIMTNGIIGVTSTVTEYRRNGVLKRLAATPLTKMNWIVANVMQQTLLAFILTAVMIIIGMLFFNVRVFPDIYAIVFIFTGAVAFSCIGMVLGGFIKDVEAASGAGNAIAFPMMFLSGAFWSVDMMPSYLQTVAEFLPLYYFHQGLLEIMILEDHSEAFWPYFIILAFAVVFILLAFRITKWKEL